jgi:outer membrane protein
MRKNLRQIVLAAAGVAALSAGLASQVTAETLPEVIALAYQSNPSLLSQRAQVRALEENYGISRGAIRPYLSVSASHAYGKAQGRDDSNYDSASLSASQALYTGGRTANALHAIEAQVMAAREGLRRTEAGVMQAVIQAYVDVRRDLESLRIRQENVAVLKRQLEEANARFDVGEITKTDVNQAAARYAAAQAQLAAAQSQLAASRAAYTSVVGQAPGDLAPEPALTAIPASVEQAFNDADNNSPVLLQATYTEQASRARIDAAKSERMPTVSVQAQLGFNDQSTRLMGGSAGNFDRNLSAAAVVTQPLFTGGIVAARVRQAVESNNSDRLQIDVARRSVVQAVSQSWAQLLASRSAIIANEEQVRAAGVAFEGTKQENQVGLRTTLDVLNAEQELRNAQLSLVNARHDSYVAGAQLLNAMGVLEADKLSTQVTVYDAAASFNAIRNGWTITPWDRIIETVDVVGTRRPESLPASETGAKVDPNAPVAKAKRSWMPF